jgi:hypothetical protein
MFEAGDEGDDVGYDVRCRCYRYRWCIRSMQERGTAQPSGCVGLGGWGRQDGGIGYRTGIWRRNCPRRSCRVRLGRRHGANKQE